VGHNSNEKAQLEEKLTRLIDLGRRGAAVEQSDSGSYALRLTARVFAQLLPGPDHVPPAFFYPQFVPLASLLYWMIRLRVTARFKNDALPLSAFD
jgi:hypothetical protein